MGAKASPADEQHGRRIRALRVLAGLKQSELAERAGVSRKTVYSAERGRRLLPACSEAIARALGIQAEHADP